MTIQMMLIYALKTVVYSGIFFGYYCLALRNKRFHYYNRFYLLLSVMFSLLLPFLTIGLWRWHSSHLQIIQMLAVANTNSVEVVAGTNSTFFDWNNLALSLYSIIALYLLLALVYSIVALVRIRQAHKVDKIDNVNFINTDLQQAPFSFFNNLFWKRSLSINSVFGRQIFKHELTHIQQKHSWDKVFLKIVCAVCWFNPVYWLIQKELALIHEFIADEKAIEDKSAEAFALMILQSQYTKNIFSPAQSFFYSPIKRRLLMLTTSSRTNYSYARRIMVLPLLAATVLFFAFTLKDDTTNSSVNHVNAPFVLVVDAGHGGTDNGAYGFDNTLEKDINLAIARTIEQLAPEYGISVKMTRTSDVDVSLKDRINFITEQKPDASISIHVNSSPGQTDSTEMDVFITRNDKGNAYDKSRLLGSSVLQSVMKHFQVNNTIQQRKNEGIYILDKNPFPTTLIECGYINNPAYSKQLATEAVKEKIARDILEGITAYANADKSDLLSNSMGKTLATQSNSLADTGNKKAPLYIVDGKETPIADAQKIDANNIQSINVIKGDEAAIKRYGQKAANGVVVVTMKQNGTSKNGSQASPTLDGKPSVLDSVLVVLDGKIIDSKEAYLISPNDIEAIDVLKDEMAANKYGKKGSKGVIEITSKKQTVSSASNFTIPSSDTALSKAIVYIDGKESSREKLKAISPDDIQSVSVWKGTEAVKKYGEKGREGVIEVKMKH